MNSNFKILILNGPLEGEVFTLPLKTFKIGEDGDIWSKFDSKTLNVELTISEKGVKFISDLPCWINGELRDLSESTKNKALPTKTPIDLDGFCFIILHSNDIVETLTKDKKVVPIRQNQNSDENKISKSKITINQYSDIKYLIKYLILILLVGLTSGIGIWRYIQKEYNSKITITKTGTENWIKKQLSKEIYSNIQYSFPEPGKIVFTGRCKKENSLKSLIQPLKDSGWYIKNDIFCDDIIIENINYILTSFGFNKSLIYSSDKPGNFIIEGDIESNEQWDKVEDFLSKLVGLDSWEVYNKQIESLDLLITQLEEAELDTQIDITQKNEKIILTGKISEKDANTVKDIINHMKSIYPNNTYIFQNIKTAMQKEDIWPAQIISIGGNSQNPFIELNNGERLQIGSQLESGYQIAEIDIHKGIKLTKKNKVINIPINI